MFKLLSEPMSVPCECSELDYECEEGFERISDESVMCAPIDHMQT